MSERPLVGQEVTVPKHDCKGTVKTYRDTTESGTLLTIETVTGERVENVPIADVVFQVAQSEAAKTVPAPAPAVTEQPDFSDLSTRELAEGIRKAIDRGQRVSPKAVKALAERVLVQTRRAA